MSFENWNDSDISYENDYEAYNDTEDEEGYEISDSESFNDYSEARRRRKEARGVGGRPMGRTQTKPFRGQGTVNTPAGAAHVKLPENLVTKAEFLELEKKVLANNKAILVNGKAINTLNSTTKRLEDVIARQGKALAETNRRIGDIQQASLISALIPPKLTSLTLGTPSGGVTPVTNSQFDPMGMLLPVMMSGGLGGNSSGGNSSGGSSSGGNNSMNYMLPLILITQNNSGTTGSSNNNNNLMLAMVMMMGMGGNNSGNK
jgi:hypothetical protein